MNTNQLCSKMRAESQMKVQTGEKSIIPRMCTKIRFVQKSAEKVSRTPCTSGALHYRKTAKICAGSAIKPANCGAHTFLKATAGGA